MVDVGLSDVRIADIAVSDNGHIVLAGVIFGGQNQQSAAVLICTSIDGSEKWRFEQEYGYSSRFVNPIMLNDNDCVVLEITQSKESTHLETKIIHISNGTIISSIPLRPGSMAFIPSLLKARDGYFVFGGEYDIPDIENEITTIPFLEPRDANGEMRWKKIFSDHAIKIYGTFSDDDGYWLYGSETYPHTSNEERAAALLRISNDGDMLWYTSMSGENWPTFIEAIPVRGGGVLALGVDEKTVVSNGEVVPVRKFLTLVSSTGDIVWERNLVTDDQTYGIRNLLNSQNGFLAFVSDENGTGRRQVAELNFNGEIVNINSEYVSPASQIYSMFIVDKQFVVIDLLANDNRALWITPISKEVAAH